VFCASCRNSAKWHALMQEEEKEMPVVEAEKQKPAEAGFA
jgi:hypothetical protein